MKRIDQDMISALQAWSDAHTTRTNADVFTERYPNSLLRSGIPFVYPCHVDQNYEFEKCNMYIRSDDCCEECKEAYWNAPYEEPAESEAE